jgi:hypothetical protein
VADRGVALHDSDRVGERNLKKQLPASDAEAPTPEARHG